MNHKAVSLLVILLLPLLFSFCGNGKSDRNVKPNILLITVDTLRRDHLGVYGYPRETSPYLDELAKKSLRFTNVITPIPLTAPSHASILTSLHPLTHGLNINGGILDQKVQTIAEVLKQNGYYTMGAVGVKILSSGYQFSQGFDTFSDSWGIKKKNHTAYERTAPSVNESIFEQIDTYLTGPEQNRKPLFIWVHYFDPHFPYHDQENVTFKNKLLKNEDRKGMRLYDKEIVYTDAHIKKLLDYLAEKNLNKHLLTCITSDHGEEFGEHGHVNCHVDFYSETTFVPLILNGYGVPKNKAVDTYVSTMDIAVTLLAAANLSFDYPCEGVDLLKIAKNPENYKERKFFILGDPFSIRSLQLLGHPYGYILNLDNHLKYWYVSSDLDNPGPTIDETRFTPIPKGNIKPVNDHAFTVTLPRDEINVLKYAILRADVKHNKGTYIRMKLWPNAQTDRVAFTRPIKHFTIILPAAFPDQIQAIITFKPGTRLDNVRYTYISKKEFHQMGEFKEKKKNNMFAQLLTQRKKKSLDEFYDLAGDIAMEHNLAAEKQFKPIIAKYKKIIYNVYSYYQQKGKKLLQGMKIQELTDEDKKMLESLGYL